MLLPLTALADTHTAATANRDDVETAINAATYGDTVAIPAGTGTGYTSPINVTKDIKIQGAGYSSTFIDSEITTQSVGIFNVVFDSTAEDNIEYFNTPGHADSPGIFEVSGITFAGTKVYGVVPVMIEPPSKVIRKIRIHHNRVVNMARIVGGNGTGKEIGMATGVVDNNFLHNTIAYVFGASIFNLSNRSYPGDGTGWYIEDNIFRWSGPTLSRSTDLKKVKNVSSTYWLPDHTFVDVAETETALPAGTIPQNTWGIYRVSTDALGAVTLTAGTDNYTTGYGSSALAIAAVPAVPENQANMGYITIVNTAGDFVCGTTLLNAAGVTYSRYGYPQGSFLVSADNNDGLAATIRYNIVTGLVDYSYNSTQQIYFDEHSNQSSITGGQHLELYGNNMTATRGDLILSYFSDIRGQKNLYFYNRMPDTSTAVISLREEWNDHGSASQETLDALNMCSSRATKETEGDRQTCPGYLIGTPDSCNCWKVHDSYFLNNRRATDETIHNAIIAKRGTPLENFDYFDNDTTYTLNDPPELVENIEFFNYVALGSFDGTVGVSCGTAAEMNAITPTTVGVGFWVPTNITTMPCTSVSADNIKQTEGVNPVTPITGTLYKWTGSAWAAYWQPYTYPHPLRGKSRAAVTFGSTSASGAGRTMGSTTGSGSGFTLE
ncbi:MAG: hypothetical protein WC332_00850 [Clostridia bacterium]